MKLNVRLLIGILITVLFAFVLMALVFMEVPDTNTDVLKVLIGFIGGAFTTMVAYYFGDKEG